MEVISGGGKVVEQIVCGAAHCAAVVNLSMGELEIQGQLWTWGNGVAALATADAAHAEIPRPFHLTKKGHESIEVFRIAAGDKYERATESHSRTAPLTLPLRAVSPSCLTTRAASWSSACTPSTATARTP